MKTLEEFDSTFQPSNDEKLIKELVTMAFACRTENVIFLGPPGVGGNTPSYKACHRSSVAGDIDLFQLPYKAYEENRLEKRMKTYTRLKLFVIDKVGYLPLDGLV